MKFILLAAIFLVSCADLDAAKQGELVGTSPDNSSDLYTDTSFILVFTEIVEPDSITAQEEDGACETDKSVLLSSDDFVNCYGGAIEDSNDVSGRRAVFNPTNDLPQETNLKLKLTKNISFKDFNNMSEVILEYRTGTETTPEDATSLEGSLEANSYR